MMQDLAQACTQHSVAILVMLLTAFGFGLLLGYFLWNKYVALSTQHLTEREEWRNRYVDRDAEFQTLDLDHQKGVADLRKLRNEHTSLDAETRGLRGELNFLRQANAKPDASAKSIPDEFYPSIGSVSKADHEALQSRFESLKSQHASSLAELSMLNKRLEAPRAEAAFAKTVTNPAAISPALAFQVPTEGLAERQLPPALVTLLLGKHINDWSELADLEPSQLETLLSAEGHAYVPAQFRTWIAQARRIVGDSRPVAPPTSEES